jgi:hypothetical protein
MSEIFTTRIQEAVYHDRADPSRGKPIKKEPDRIIGLRQTSTIQRLLQKPYVHGASGENQPRFVGDIKNCINPENGGSPLLFPFLVLEAKSEKGAIGFERIEAQSSLPIFQCLKLQYELMKITGNTVDVPGGPLVWFFANAGENWRVYAGYIIERDDVPKYVSSPRAL